MADEGAIETVAKEMGWNPEFTGTDDKPALSAEDFIRKGAEIQDTMRQHMKDQKSKISNLEGTLSELRMGVDEIRQHNERVYKVQVQKLQDELVAHRASRKQAIEEGDADQVEAIEKKIATTQEAAHIAAPAATPTGPRVDPVKAEEDKAAFEKWAEKNDWFNKDREMTQTAQALALDYQNKGIPYKAMLRKVSKDMQEIFPETFEKAEAEHTTKAPPSPEGATRTGSATKSKYSSKDLTPEQRDTMKRFVKMGVMTETEYIADLAKIGVLGG